MAQTSFFCCATYQSGRMYREQNSLHCVQKLLIGREFYKLYNAGVDSNISQSIYAQSSIFSIPIVQSINKIHVHLLLLCANIVVGESNRSTS